MELRGQVLIADDDETFSVLTADLLIREGYEVRRAPDAATARDILENSPSELLIADIKMRGNWNLELIEAIAGTKHEVPVILATGDPDVPTAVKAISLPVIAYLLKPIAFADLLGHVERGVRIGQSNRRMALAQNRLGDLQKELNGHRNIPARAVVGPSSVGSFVAMTMGQIMDSLSDLQHLALAEHAEKTSKPVCHLLDCPRLTMATNALTEGVATLERTKQSFKSRELADLRHYLETICSALRA